MGIRSRKDVAELKARLQEYRSEVLLHVTFLLSEDQSSINLGIAKIRDDSSQLKIGFRTQITSTQNKILGAIDDLTKSTSQELAKSDRGLADISRLLRTIQAMVENTHLQHRVLRQLVFEDMDSRAHQIRRAAQGTYDWIFEDDPLNNGDQQELALNLFLDWLRAGGKVLHVSGNPGSGKSTLMKFFSQNERTKEELQVWARTDTLILCAFYFWNPGSTLQRTLAGLYRSLLFQALSQCPELTEDAFPAQLKRMRNSIGDTMVERIQMFGEHHIEEAFKLLLTRVSTGGYRMCIFIDGLDECDGGRLEHEEFSGMLQGWATSENIKLCLSSRPYPEFIRPLNVPGNRLIQLHELNSSDIRAYCLNRLTIDVDARERAEICRQLVETVVQNAQGVFLWVHLVIDVLLVGFRQGDPDSVLKAQLEALPSDLDTMYTKLREPIEKDDIQRDRSNRMLLLAANNLCHRDLPAVAFSWLEEEGSDRKGLMSPDFPSAFKMKPYSQEEVSSRINRVTRQINGLARGFLEVWKDEDDFLEVWKEECETLGRPLFYTMKVGFCHRTARDYLLQNEHRRLELLKSFPNFDNCQTYARIRLAETIHGENSKLPHNHQHFMDFPELWLKMLDPDLISKFEFPLRELLTPTFIRMDEYNLIGKGPRALHDQPSRISFIVYDAHCGLNQFVLREAAKEETKLSGTSRSGSVLLAAANRENYELISALLRMEKGMNELCVVFDDDGNVRPPVPACVFVTTSVFRSMLGRRDTQFFRGNLPTLATDLLKHSHGLGISMWATIRGRTRPSVSTKPPEENFITCIRFRINVANIIELFENLMAEIKDCNTESLSSWAIGVIQEMSCGEDGPVKGGGRAVIRWLRECLKHYESINSGRTNQDRMFLEVENMEWSSDTQEELLELRGWTRLY